MFFLSLFLTRNAAASNLCSGRRAERAESRLSHPARGYEREWELASHCCNISSLDVNIRTIPSMRVIKEHLSQNHIFFHLRITHAFLSRGDVKYDRQCEGDRRCEGDRQCEGDNI